MMEIPSASHTTMDVVGDSRDATALGKKKRTNWQPPTIISLLRYLIEKYEVF
jgi:hypothetical protein